MASDYNLLLISRFKEESGTGLETGTIRAMAGSGAVVVSAALVCAARVGRLVQAGVAIRSRQALSALRRRWPESRRR